MRIDVQGRARIQPGSASLAGPVARSTRVYAWVAAAGIGAALAVMIAASLTRASWMGPPLAMPRIGPPYELGNWRIPLDDMTVALWLSAVVAGVGVAAGLVAVRRGARPPVGLLIGAGALVVAILTVLPPVGSTDSLDYMAFGRIMVLGHSPYVMVPWDLKRAHDAVGVSIPWEWGKATTPYGPAATAEQYLAALLGGASAARIVFWLKMANAVAFGAVAYTADRLLRSDPAGRLRAHLLWTINPLLIWQLIAAAHLDVLAAAAGLLGLVIAGGLPTLPATGYPPLGRVLAGGALIGLAADIKITFVLFGLGLAWALRRSPMACLASACAMFIVLLPSYAWFGMPAIKAVVGRGNRTTADNFYQLFASTPHSFLINHIAVIAGVIVVGAATVALGNLPGRATAQPAIFAALAFSAAWLFTWQYQLPSYDAMIVCLLIVVPACWLDWLVIARLVAGTVALMPGNPTPLPSHLLSRISNDDLTLAAPIVLITALVAMLTLCVAGGWRSRRPSAGAPTAPSGPSASGVPGPGASSPPGALAPQSRAATG
jgi:hypothetical protein